MRRKFYITAEELISGYNLPPIERCGRKRGVSSTQRVTLRARPLRGGAVSLYLYSSFGGKVDRRTIGKLEPEADIAAKSRNIEAMRLARAREGQENAAAVTRAAGFNPKHDKVLLLDYVGHIAERVGKCRHNVYFPLAQHLERYIDGRRIYVADVGRDFLTGFCRYINTAVSLKTGKPLSDGTKSTYYAKMLTLMNSARRDGLTNLSPFGLVDRKDLPKQSRTKREYLTADEVGKLAATDCHKPEIKRAFLFCCFAGLRFSDVLKLTWRDIGRDDNGIFVRVTMQKTKELVTAYLPNTVLTLIQRPTDAKDNDIVFNLKDNWHTNEHLRRWAASAGIKKHITFHTSRHTCATMLLNVGAPLEVVAKQLGHADVSTTQIYANILNRTLSKEVAKIDNLGIVL